MKYGVRFTTGSMNDESKTNSFDEACSTAISYSNWNLGCEVIDLETGEILKSFAPYSKIFAS